MTNPKAVIFGCQTTRLLDEERAFFERTNPLGFILFSRNCESPSQIQQLVHDLKKSVGRNDAPILIDQEGGRVARLSPPQWRAAPASGIFGLMAEEDPEKASWCVRTGHGQATVDSHEKLPVVSASLEDLAASDFEAFRQVSQHFKRQTDMMPWAMTAHIIYSAIDSYLPATQSPVVIESVIRGHIGFTGFLVSDCLTMKALEGSFGKRALKSLEAGCDAVLHCSGVLEEMIEVAAQTLPLRNESVQRLNRSLITPQANDFESEEEALIQLEQNLRLEGFQQSAERKPL
jgi:beta-N-acetylhexosaminidase